MTPILEKDMAMFNALLDRFKMFGSCSIPIPFDQYKEMAEAYLYDCQEWNGKIHKDYPLLIHEITSTDPDITINAVGSDCVRLSRCEKIPSSSFSCQITKNGRLYGPMEASWQHGWVSFGLEAYFENSFKVSQSYGMDSGGVMMNLYQSYVSLTVGLGVVAQLVKDCDVLGSMALHDIKGFFVDTNKAREFLYALEQRTDITKVCANFYKAIANRKRRDLVSWLIDNGKINQTGKTKGDKVGNFLKNVKNEINRRQG